MSGESRSKALATVSEYANAAQHTHGGEFEWGAGPDGNRVTGYIFTDTFGHTYRVYGPSEYSYMYISSFFDAVHSLAPNLREHQIEHYLRTPFASPESEDEDDAVTATRALLDSIDTDKMSDLKETILGHIDTPETRGALSETDNGSARQIFVHRKILPYQDGFSGRDFLDSTRYVTYASSEAVDAYLEVINSADIGLEPDQEEMDSHSTEFDGLGRSFQ